MSENTLRGSGTAGCSIEEVLCLRAQYRVGQQVVARVGLLNATGKARSGVLHVSLLRLAGVEQAIDIPLEPLAPGRSSRSVSVLPRASAYAGYGLDLSLDVEGVEQANASASFDVSVTGREVIRYGFLSHFAVADGGSDLDLDFLLRLHITDVQFYDWMYRHDTLLPPCDQFEDLMGKPISLPVVREKVEGCHRRGMRALAYGAVYAASAEFRDVHPDWGLYDGAEQPYNLIERFYIMDIARGSPWTRHILDQFGAARSALGFDGFHLDSYGFPKRALSRWGGTPALRLLDQDFPAFIEAARSKLGDDSVLVFNNVNGWPVEATAGSPQSAVYIEVWPPHERYCHLADLVRGARQLGGEKPIILAAYLAPFRTVPGSKAARSAALLLISSLAALGAQHLLFGEERGVLTQAYYVDFTTLEESFVPVLERYCDFLVRYSEVFFDPALREVTATHLGGDAPEYVLRGGPISCWGEGGTVWPIIREKRNRKTICLVNLTGNSSDQWNEGKAEPVVQEELTAEITVHGSVGELWWASPDAELGRPRSLEYRVERGPGGMRLHVRIPPLRFFGVLVLELS